MRRQDVVGGRLVFLDSCLELDAEIQHTFRIVSTLLLVLVCSSSLVDLPCLVL